MVPQGSRSSVLLFMPAKGLRAQAESRLMEAGLQIIKEGHPRDQLAAAAKLLPVLIVVHTAIREMPVVEFCRVAKDQVFTRDTPMIVVVGGDPVEGLEQVAAMTGVELLAESDLGLLGELAGSLTASAEG